MRLLDDIVHIINITRVINMAAPEQHYLNGLFVQAALHSHSLHVSLDKFLVCNWMRWLKTYSGVSAESQY